MNKYYFGAKIVKISKKVALNCVFFEYFIYFCGLQVYN
jgi:hypothetical protein